MSSIEIDDRHFIAANTSVVGSPVIMLNSHLIPLIQLDLTSAETIQHASVSALITPDRKPTGHNHAVQVFSLQVAYWRSAASAPAQVSNQADLVINNVAVVDAVSPVD